ncbi:cathepsin L-like [Cloeon dipterum]|uniref:cathepsin L-like n=1 Tax=Cloeon dipterum TaxID=197152 RepID=UPI0032201ABB
MKVLPILSLFALLCNAEYDDVDIIKNWISFKDNYSKTYGSPLEEIKQFRKLRFVFKQLIETINLQTGSLEGQQFRKTGNLVLLSEQNLIDCSGWLGNFGCGGGETDLAFQYAISDGIDTEESYPYQGINGTCRYNASQVGATAAGFMDIGRGDEDDLQAAVATMGPVSVVINAKDSFRFYAEGVYYEPECSSKDEDLNHALLVIGYGTDDKTGMDYWLVKNSWGTDWGDEGYAKMARNKDNNCGIATMARFPLVW